MVRINAGVSYDGIGTKMIVQKERTERGRDVTRAAIYDRNESVSKVGQAERTLRSSLDTQSKKTIGFRNAAQNGHTVSRRSACESFRVEKVVSFEKSIETCQSCRWSRNIS